MYDAEFTLFWMDQKLLRFADVWMVGKDVLVVGRCRCKLVLVTVFAPLPSLHSFYGMFL